MSEYIAAIHKDKDSDYGVSFPDFPGCITAGADLEEARQMATEALRGHIEVSREYGDPIPEPSTLEEVKTMEDFKDAEAFFVIQIPNVKEKKVRVNITLTQSDLRLIDQRARKRNLSRSAFLADIARKDAEHRC
jgi:predicted RNase H-like HicB family nuclease